MLYELIPSMPEHRLLPLMSGSPKCCSAVGCSAGFCRRRNEGTDEGWTFKRGEIGRSGQAQPGESVSMSIDAVDTVKPCFEQESGRSCAVVPRSNEVAVVRGPIICLARRGDAWSRKPQCPL